MSSIAPHIDALSARLAEVEARFTTANPLSHARHERAQKVLPAGHTRQTRL